MPWYKRWKWQAAIAAPCLPWFYIHYIDWLQETAKALGWVKDAAGIGAVVLTIVATIVFGIAYFARHEDDD